MTKERTKHYRSTLIYGTKDMKKKMFARDKLAKMQQKNGGGFSSTQKKTAANGESEEVAS